MRPRMTWGSAPPAHPPPCKNTSNSAPHGPSAPPMGPTATISFPIFWDDNFSFSLLPAKKKTFVAQLLLKSILNGSKPFFSTLTATMISNPRHHLALAWVAPLLPASAILVGAASFGLHHCFGGSTAYANCCRLFASTAFSLCISARPQECQAHRRHPTNRERIAESTPSSTAFRAPRRQIRILPPSPTIPSTGRQHHENSRHDRTSSTMVRDGKLRFVRSPRQPQRSSFHRLNGSVLQSSNPRRR